LAVGKSAEIRVAFATLMLTLYKALEFDAAEALWDWAEEWLDVDRDELEEDLQLEDTDA
jgi:hypothetical protein